MTKGADTQLRLIAYAARTLHLRDMMPNRMEYSHLFNQLVRSATSAAGTYAEARGTEGVGELRERFTTVLKQLVKSKVCIELLVDRAALQGEGVAPILEECKELCAVIVEAIRDVGENRTT